ncbi:MAG: hypothetical protein KKC71_11415 [Chloroflexi bacterium]|nr:hypothetical protein [Chloroflexota bacterium]
MAKRSNTLNFIETGTDGPTLVFIPGLSGTTRYWQGTAGRARKELPHPAGGPARLRRFAQALVALHD